MQQDSFTEFLHLSVLHTCFWACLKKRETNHEKTVNKKKRRR
jgi:hypothetical protein